jgi:hypothetical protein
VVSRFPLPSPALTRSLQDGPVRSARWHHHAARHQDRLQCAVRRQAHLSR